MLNDIQIKKIKLILESYKKIDARLWTVGTDIYGSMFRLLNNFKESFSNQTNNNFLEVVGPISTLVRNRGHNDVRDRWQLTFNQKNITPTKNANKKSAAERTIIQYIQEATALGFLNVNKNFSFSTTKKYLILPRLLESINNNTRDFLVRNIYNMLIRSCTSCLYFERNLGYSLFLSLLLTSNETSNIFNINIKHEIISVQSTRSEVGTFLWNDSETVSKLKHVRDDEHTYDKTCLELLNLNPHITFKLIDDMIDFIKNIDPQLYDKYFNVNIFVDNEDKNEWAKFASLQRTILETKAKVQSRRSLLKENICKARVYSNEYYSDFENFPLKMIANLIPCHIYEVWSIKDEVGDLIIANKPNYEIERCISQADDPSNGLLMTSQCHSCFDQGLFGFDPKDGKIWIIDDEEAKLRVYDAFGLEPNKVNSIKIKSSSFSPEMQHYLKKRI